VVESVTAASATSNSTSVVAVATCRGETDRGLPLGLLRKWPMRLVVTGLLWYVRAQAAPKTTQEIPAGIFTV
jgi:hypothetical protein